MKISYSAPAKIILSGEHAVVYGKPSLISALSMRLRVTVEEGSRSSEQSNLDQVSGNVLHYLRSRNIKHREKNYHASIISQIPEGRNLGSSAALAVAGSAAFLHFYTGREFSKEEINSVAYLSEKKFHGNPSGADNSTSCFGGLIYYRKEFEFLKNISALNFKLPEKIISRIYLVDSGKAEETTAEMVAKVGKLYNEQPKQTEQIMNAIEKTTKRTVISITTENMKMFEESIVENEKLLEELMVVSDRTKKLLASLREVGAGKITGAGGYKRGSGNVLFLVKDPKDAEEYFKKQKIPYTKFRQDFDGVRNI